MSKQVVLIDYPFAGMWRSAAQQLSRQKLDALGRRRSSTTLPVLLRAISYQSTANHDIASVQSVEKSSDFKPRFLKPYTPSLSPLDSAFIELVDLLPQCWHNPSATDTDQNHNVQNIRRVEDENDTRNDPDARLDFFVQNTKKEKQRELYERQVKIETEAWQQAADEYKIQMTEMCRKSLAPNLPFAQSLLLSWFEPLRFVFYLSLVL